MEIGRRLRKNVRGIGVPGHFVVEYRDDEFASYIDCFHGGRFITESDCWQMSLTYTNIDIENDPNALRPVTRAAMLTRMLNNILGVYLDDKRTHKSVQVLDLLIEAHPEETQYYRARAAVHLGQKRYRLANADLQMAIDRATDSADRGELTKHMLVIQHKLGQLN